VLTPCANADASAPAPAARCAVLTAAVHCASTPGLCQSVKLLRLELPNQEPDWRKELDRLARLGCLDWPALAEVGPPHPLALALACGWASCCLGTTTGGLLMQLRL
jgi:hypothetical protein